MDLRRWIAPQTEMEARIELAAAYRYAYDLGWTDLGATHFSLRVPGEPGAYLMLREGLFFNEVTAGNLVKLRLDDDPDSESNASVNPAGVTIHGAILGGNTKVNSVMHTHTPAGVGVANYGPYGLMRLSQHALRFFEAHEHHDYEGIALDDEEGPRLVENLGDNELLLLRQHGLLTAGADLPHAFSAMYYAQRASEIQVATLSHGTIISQVSKKVARRTKEQYDASHGYMYRDWMAIIRQVERAHPGYKEIQDQ